jgi:hypothetical protein
MNLYIKKISTLAGVGVISILSTFQTFTNVDAALTAPTNYDIAYTSVGGAFIMTAPAYTTNSTYPLFTRTTDSIYFNYTHNFSSGQHTNTSNFYLPEDLDITMIFNRSNTSWTDASSAGYTGYYATDTKIGSDNNVGTIPNKIFFEIDNQTTHDYLFLVDFSSTSSGTTISMVQEYSNSLTTSFIHNFTTNLFPIIIPAFNSLQLGIANATAVRYFDAWYLQDLGESASFDAGRVLGNSLGYEEGYLDGYDDGLGNNPNVLINGFSAMVGILVNFMLLILNLEAFGISILSVFGVLAFFVGVIWFFKLLRG